jgi:imidazolonepropionase-like amidohydrolase
MTEARVLDERSIALCNVNVVPVATPGVLSNRHVVVEHGRITRISEPSAPLPSVDVTVQGGGRWLVPGLSDMHVHITDAEQLSVMVAHGITHVRNMWGSPEIRALRDEVHRGARLGPAIVTAGPLVDGSPPVWPGSTEIIDEAEADTAVSAQQAAGYDFVKVYSNLEPRVFDAIAVACQERGFPFAGHVPYRVPLEEAIESGADSFEHLLGFKRATARPEFPFGVLARAPENLAVARRVAAGELALHDVFDFDRLAALASRIAAVGLWTCPTLVVIRNLLYTRAQSQQALTRPESRYVPSALLDFWSPDKDFRRAGTGDEDLEALQSLFALDIACVAALHRAGARLLVGTDTPNPYVVPGDAMHEELELLVSAGLTPSDALYAATAAAAEFRGEAGGSGVVVEGASADLVLVDADPLEDIRALRQIAGVMLRGRWLDRGDLDAELARCADHYATRPTTFVTPGGYGGMLPLCSCCR